MKKDIVFLLLIVCIFLQVAGCSKEKIANSKNKNESIGTTVSKSEADIRKIAYESMTKEMKDEVIDWKSAIVGEYRYTMDVKVATPDGLVDIKGKDTYMVIFDAKHGGIVIYLDKDSYTFLGAGLRE
jgi:PBP1b-binding outer membrane lipoprotein LpoB